MYNSLESENRNKGPVFERKGENTEFSDLDILRKAYELILENSDLFFNELANAFANERKRRESHPLF